MTNRPISPFAAALFFSLLTFPSLADESAAERWIASEFQPSVLSKDEQKAETDWFLKATAPYRGMEIRVVSDKAVAHEYEARILGQAFFEITGVRVYHELLPEDELAEKLQKQLFSTNNIFDAWLLDSDFVTTLSRADKAVALSDWMAGEGKDTTSPTLDLKDMIGLAASTAQDGKLYQLPDQQATALYWFRHDWFSNEDYKAKFKAEYNYELGVPLNWSAYEDIAAFFSKTIGMIDGAPVYGHLEDLRNEPFKEWRVSSSYLTLGGAGSPGLPHGRPVDTHGIRYDGCRASGVLIRSPEQDNPSMAYSIGKPLDWLNNYAPPEARDDKRPDSGSLLAKGNVAQQLSFMTTGLVEMMKPGARSARMANGTPKWRVAPSPLGVYWRDGMRRGYQNSGGWTLLHSTPLDRRKAAWLYAQFATSKTASLRKAHVSLTFARESDIAHKSFKERASQLGGLVEFYRSRYRREWAPTGNAIADHHALAKIWHDVFVSRKDWPKTLQINTEKAMADSERDYPDDPCRPDILRMRHRGDDIEAQIFKPATTEKPPGKTRTYLDMLFWLQGTESMPDE